MEKKIIGACPVDSGQLIIIDPSYLREWRDGDHDDTRSHYGQTCAATLGEDGGGEVLISAIAGVGVAFSTGYGDGYYPVKATYEDGRIKKIEIIFF
jgi:hypothetical protein